MTLPGAPQKPAPAGNPPAALAPWPYPLWIAHRGAGLLAPENTLAAMRVGASHGYRAFECDVKLSADGVPFLLHDNSLRRTTPESGVAGKRPWSELSRIDAGGWHSRGFAGEPLPSLEAVARWALRNGHLMNIEIKATPSIREHTGKVVAETCQRLWQGTEVPPLLSSFRPEALLGAREGAPALPRALLLETLWPGWFEMVQQLGCVAVVTDYNVMDADLMARLHGAGLRALCYTVNDPPEARRLLALGIDGIITDAVDRFSPLPAGLAD